GRVSQRLFGCAAGRWHQLTNREKSARTQAFKERARPWGSLLGGSGTSPLLCRSQARSRCRFHLSDNGCSDLDVSRRRAAAAADQRRSGLGIALSIAAEIGGVGAVLEAPIDVARGARIRLGGQ